MLCIERLGPIKPNHIIHLDFGVNIHDMALLMVNLSKKFGLVIRGFFFSDEYFKGLYASRIHEGGHYHLMPWMTL